MSFDIDGINMIGPIAIEAPNDNTPLTLYTVGPIHIRPIMISVEKEFTGNLNEFTLNLSLKRAVYLILDPDLAKPQFTTISTGHLRGFWWKPGYTLIAHRDGVTVEGFVYFGMMYEEFSSYGEPKEDLGVTKTQPRWKVPSFFKR